MRPLANYSRVIVRLPNALGDAVMASIAIRRLAAQLEPQRLCLAGPRVAVDVLAGNPWAEYSLVVDRKGAHRGLPGAVKLAAEIERGGYGLAVIFPNSIGSALPFFLARVPERLGYFKEGRRLLLTAGQPRDHDEHGHFVPKYTGQYFDELVRLIPGLDEPRAGNKGDGGGESRVESGERSVGREQAGVGGRVSGDNLKSQTSNLKLPQLFTEPRGEAECAKWMQGAGLSDGEPFFVVVPGAAFGPSKIWLLERYAHVADELARRKQARVLISHGPGEEGIAAAVKARMQARALPDARVSIAGLKSIYKRASFVLANDTGPRHIAVAFGIPHVVIMGPNDPRYTHLDDDGGEVVRARVACSPCQLKVCPRVEQTCMTWLHADVVLERCLAMWPSP